MKPLWAGVDDTLAARLAAAEAERDDRLGVPEWARGEPEIPERGIEAG